MAMVGGISQEKCTNLKGIQHIIDQVKDQAKIKLGSDSLGKYEVVSYKTQVVAGTNYFVKVKIDDNNYIHLRVFRPLPPNHETYELSGIQVNKKEDDEICYF